MSDTPARPAPAPAPELTARHADPWPELRQHTPARLALGRVGASLPTGEVLAFSLAHARARDAVHASLDAHALARALQAAGFSTLQARSRARDRAEYLRRPDLGRNLHPDCCAALLPPASAPHNLLAIVVADGLSSHAPARHALPLLVALRDRLHASPSEWTLDAVTIATQARVALGDQIAALRHAAAVAVLIGERPGLGSPDSLGIYLTYAPRVGITDAERNCISNVRAAGMCYPEAAYKLHYLLTYARRAGATGIGLKDASDWQPAAALPAI